MFQTYETRGGAGLEVVLTDDLWDVDDIHPFTPAEIEFAYMVDEATGKLSLEIVPNL